MMDGSSAWTVVSARSDDAAARARDQAVDHQDGGDAEQRRHQRGDSPERRAPDGPAPPGQDGVAPR